MMYRNGQPVRMGAVGLGRAERASERAINDPLAARGAQMAAANPLIAAARNAGPSDEWRRGFDIGTAKSAGNSLPGPGQNAVLDGLPSIAMKNGFLAARAQQYAMTLAGGSPSPELTQGPGSPGGGSYEDGGVSPVMIGAGVVGVGAIGVIAWLFLKKKK